MSNGEVLRVRAAMKPLATLNRPTLKTVDTVTKAETVAVVGGQTVSGLLVDKVGMDGFNAVWTSPETLPLPHEIAAPDAAVSPAAPMSSFAIWSHWPARVMALSLRPRSPSPWISNTGQ